MAIDKVENGGTAYTIPALVLPEAGTLPSLGWPAVGDVIMVRRGVGRAANWDIEGHYYSFDERNPEDPFPFFAEELILNPTPEQIKAAALVNEAKAGA